MKGISIEERAINLAHYIIEVDSDSNVEVRLKLLNEIGSTPAVITNFNDINTTVTESNISTQRCFRKIVKN